MRASVRERERACARERERAGERRDGCFSTEPRRRRCGDSETWRFLWSYGKTTESRLVTPSFH